MRVREIYRPHVTKIVDSASRAVKVSGQFKRLLQKNFLEFRKVDDYAGMMHISPKHLTDLVKEATGKTPKQLINDVLLLEAKVMLGSTDRSITDIAHTLKFQDQSHFSHFVRKQEGCSPLELRKKL